VGVRKGGNYMKKIVLSILLLIVIMLSGCDKVDPPLSCVPGYVEENGVCVLEEVECEDNEILVDGVCELEVDTSYLDGPEYQSQGYDEYLGRDIVSSTCEDLDNIGEWQPVWCDEFNYEGLPDSSLWSYDVGGSGWGNNELQYYTDGDIDNAFVEDGYLTIRTIDEYYNGSDYTSARLVSKYKGDFLYGKIQVRAKVPAGLGTWPAIWMLPTDWEYGGWPTSGEIDIMEYVGYEPDVFHSTIHTAAYNHSLGTQIGKSRTLNTVEEEFHVFEIEWEPNVIRYYIDGLLFFTVGYDPEDSYTVEPYEAWPFDKDFHLILNTAFGGNWGGALGIDESILPVDFEIDYVRVYQKDYEGMDSENPDAVTNIRSLDIKSSEAFVAWDIASDDVMVKEYNVYLDDTLVGVSSHNGYHFTGLNAETSYEVKIVAVDFAGNLSVDSTFTLVTEGPLNVNDRIEAEEFIIGNGIETQTTTDTGGGLNVGWIDTNDYMTYEITVLESGNYTLTSRIASESTGGSFAFYSDDTLLINQTVPVTGGWQTWQSVTSTSFYLDAGTYTFKVLITSGGFNINYYEFNKVN
jgi:beta-glucanase (GH16 family)